LEDLYGKHEGLHNHNADPIRLGVKRVEEKAVALIKSNPLVSTHLLALSALTLLHSL
jgi:hypothetical protein